jgi:spore coat protein CotH
MQSARNPARAGDKPRPPAANQGADAFFGLTKIHQLHLELSADAWRKLQPPAPRFPGPGFGPPGFGPKKPAPPMPDKPADKPQADEPADVHKSAGAFGTAFPWVRGDFTANGQKFSNVGVRFKGNFTYVASQHMLRRPLKIDLDHYDEPHRLGGHKTINLSNGVTDPQRMRESISFAVYRAAGVPAPRTAYAELTLTVPGKHDKELVGLYTLVEQVDKPFLKEHFKNSKGLLLKPENLQGGLPYLGEDWSRYERLYRPKDDPSKSQKARLIAFVRFVNKSDDETFQREIASYLDVNAFLCYVAATGLLANLDSYLGFGHNFYLYLRADTNQFVFMPWDLDLSMGTWPVGGPPAQQINLSIEHPHLGKNNLIDRLFAMKEVKEKYLTVVKDLATTCFTKEKLLADIEAIEKTVQGPLDRERKAMAARKEASKSLFAGIVGEGPPLRTFVEKRTESVQAQLAGKRKGYVAAGMGFGGPGGPGGFGPRGGMKPPPGGFGPGGILAKPLLAALDAGADGKVTKEDLLAGVKKFFKESAGGKDALDAEAIAAGINRIVPRPPGFPEPPRGFGVGDLLSGPIAQRADGDKDGKISLDELAAAALKLFEESDETKRGHLDEGGLTASINRLLPAPRPGFVPPAFGGPPKRP